MGTNTFFEDDAVYESLDKIALTRWESGQTITREEWREQYEGFLNRSLYEEAIENYSIDDDAFEEARIPFFDVRDLMEAERVEWLDCIAALESAGMYALRRALISIKSRAHYLPAIADAALSGDWEEFTTLVHYSPETINDVFTDFYAAMPMEYRRDFVVGCYMHHGDSYYLCRLALRNLPRNGASELPEGYRDADEITVYRAGEEPIEEAPERISWTLSEEKARWFMNDYGLRHANHLFRAHIRPSDVIAYDNGREEQEIMQYRSVYNVEDITTD